MGGFCHTTPAAFLFITLISVLLSLSLQPLAHNLSFLSLVFFFFFLDFPFRWQREGEYSTKCLCVFEEGRTGPRYTYSTGHESRGELRGCRPARGGQVLVRKVVSCVSKIKTTQMYLHITISKLSSSPIGEASHEYKTQYICFCFFSLGREASSSE